MSQGPRETNNLQDLADPTQTANAAKGPGWTIAIMISAASLCIGFVGGVLVDGSVGLINDYKAKIPSSSTRLSPDKPIVQAALNERSAKTIKTSSAWYPDNNRIEWFIRLRPGVTTTPMKIENENPEENRKIVFQLKSRDASTRPAAVLYIHAGETARINLPSASYRLDMASTPSAMPWDIASKQPALPKFEIPLRTFGREGLDQKTLFLGASGNLRLTEQLADLPTPMDPQPRKISRERKSPDYDSIGVDEEPQSTLETDI